MQVYSYHRLDILLSILAYLPITSTGTEVYAWNFPSMMGTDAHTKINLYISDPYSQKYFLDLRTCNKGQLFSISMLSHTFLYFDTPQPMQFPFRIHPLFFYLQVLALMTNTDVMRYQHF